MHPWWECRTQLGQVRPPLACSMRHGKVALNAHIANNGGICWQLPAVVPYKRCSQVGAIFQGNVFQQTTIVVSAVECRSLALITQMSAFFACAWGSISLWLAAFGCWWWWCVTFASNCWVAGRQTRRATFGGNAMVANVMSREVISCHPEQYTPWMVVHVALFASNNVPMWTYGHVIRCACTALGLVRGITHGASYTSSSGTATTTGRCHPSCWGCNRYNGPKSLP